MQIHLVDNGSLQPESWHSLCQVARELRRVSGIPVEPASVLHSSRIPLSKVQRGFPQPCNWESKVRNALESGERVFGVVPFFFGPTGAIVDYLPERVASLKRRFGDFYVAYGRFLGEDFPDASVNLIDLIVDRVFQVMRANHLFSVPVVLVDHGSPKPQVTAVRNQIAETLRQRLGEAASTVVAASMERRQGPEYDFNEPLLERVLGKGEFASGPVVVAKMFLSPGRHAGPDGDVVSICRKAEVEYPGLKVICTELLAQHPRMAELLNHRLNQLLNQL